MLRVKGEARLAAKQVLEEMVAEGKLARTRTDRLGLPEKMDLVAGRLECKPGGFGFVSPDRKGQEDIYVAGAALGEALHGDRVLVHIDRKNRYGRSEGHIVEVLERASTRMVGRFEKDAEGARVVPFDPHFLYEVFVTHGEDGGAYPGQMVAVEPGVDVRVIIAKYGLPDPFTEDVLREAERIPSEVSAEAKAERTDFRSEDIVTIDGETARDFDDAVQVEILENGNYLLGVHIADVATYVG